MAKFFINRPIVAMVISIIMVIVGVVAMVQLPIALFPNIAPPEIQLHGDLRRRRRAHRRAVGGHADRAADAGRRRHDLHVLVQRQQRADDAEGRLRRHHRCRTPTRSWCRCATRRPQSQLPFDVQQYGVTIKKSTTSPLALFSLYSPKGTYDALFLTNYAYININDPMARVPGVGQVSIFGAGNYAMRFWVDPDTLSKLGITVSEILDALQEAEHGEPGRPDRRRAGAARAAVHLHGARPGPPHRREAVRRRRRARQRRRLGGAHARRGAHRARRAELQHDRPPERRAGGDHRHLPAARLERDRHHEPGARR